MSQQLPTAWTAITRTFGRVKALSVPCIPSCPCTAIVQRFEQLRCVPLRKFGFFVAHCREESDMWLEGIARLLSGLGHPRDGGVGYQAIRDHVDLQSFRAISFASPAN